MSAHLITLKCGLTDPGARPDTAQMLRDVITGRMPTLWAGARTDVRLIFQNPVSGAAISTGDWAAVTFRLLAADRTTLYVTKTIEVDDLTAGPPPETTVELSTTETTRTEGEYWMAVFATLSSGGLLPLGAGPLKVNNAGMLTTEPPDAIEEPVYTQNQVDALLRGRVIARIESDVLLVFSQGQYWRLPMIPIATPDGVEAESFVVINGTLVVTDEDNNAWKAELIPHTP